MTYNFQEVIPSMISPCKTAFLSRQVDGGVGGGGPLGQKDTEVTGKSLSLALLQGRDIFYSITSLACCLAKKCTLFDFCSF